MCTVYSYMYWRTLEHCVTKSMLTVLTAWALIVFDEAVWGLSRLKTGCNIYSMMLT